MELAEIMSHLLVATLSDKEAAITVLTHIVKNERADVLRLGVERSNGDHIGRTALDMVPALGLVLSGNRGGARKDPNSAPGLVGEYLQHHGPTNRTTLVQLLKDKRGWDEKKASHNLSMVPNTIKITRERVGGSSIWSLAKSEEVAA